MAIQEVETIKKTSGRSDINIILPAFANPIKNQSELRTFVTNLKNNGIDVGKYPIALHAFFPEMLTRSIMVAKLIYGDQVRMVITEMNSDLNKPEGLNEFEEMMAIGLRHNLTILIHEWSPYPDVPTGWKINIGPTDPRVQVVNKNINLLTKK